MRRFTGFVFLLKKICGNRLIPVAVLLLSIHPLLFSEEADAFHSLLPRLSLREKAAQVLMVSISGNTAVSANTVNIFRDTAPGAVILFKFNIASTAQDFAAFLRSGHQAFREAAEKQDRPFIPPLYALDNEGGSVYRTRHLTAPLPPAADTGALFSVEQTHTLYMLLGRQMKELGVHLNLAPVAEPQTGENAAVLGTRSYSPDPEQAGSYAAAAVRGMQEGGVLAAVKHFPGNGSADLHNGAAELKVDRAALLSRYCAPFKPSIEAGAAAVLVSHVTAPAVENVPFCFSKKGIALLRNDLRFSGLVITDDIAMKALRENGATAADNALRALEAGCDMVMCSIQQIYPLIVAIAEKAAAENTFARRLDEAVLRVLTAKKKAGLIDAAGTYISSSCDLKRFEKAKNEATRLLETKNRR